MEITTGRYAWVLHGPRILRRDHMALYYHRVTELEGLRNLATPWRTLLRDSGITSAPLSFEWHLAWWECFEIDGNMAVGCVYEDKRLIAIAPLMSTVELSKGIKLKTCKLMINGYSPFGGVIYANHLDAQQLDRVIEVLFENHEFDVLRLQKLPEKSQLFRNAVESKFSGVWASSQPSLTTPIIPVTGNWEDYLQTRSKSFRKSVRRKLKKFFAYENATVEEYVVRDRTDPALEIIFDISARSWKADEGTDLKSDNEGREFLRRLSDLFGAEGKISIWVLYLDDEPIAFEYLISGGGVVFPVRADFDKSKPEISPGTVLMCQVLQAMFAREHVHSYDCCSDDYSYLLSWTENRRDHQDVEFFRSSFKPLMMFAAKYKVAPFVRRLKKAPIFKQAMQ